VDVARRPGPRAGRLPRADHARRLARRGGPRPADVAARPVQLPPLHLPAEGPPPPRIWADRDPAAAARLARARVALTALAEELTIPLENLLSPDTVRRLAWSPPDPADADAVAAFLRSHGARDWQVRLTLPLLVDAMDLAA
jgi:ribonuclease D